MHVWIGIENWRLDAATAGNISKHPQCFLADMMLNALGIFLGNTGRHADGYQKITHDLMAGLAGLGKRLAFVSQKDRPVGPRLDKVFTLQALDDGIDRRAGYPKARCKINRTRLAGGGDQLGDHLNIIFSNFRLVSTANSIEFRGAVSNLFIGLFVCHVFDFLRWHGNVIKKDKKFSHTKIFEIILI